MSDFQMSGRSGPVHTSICPTNTSKKHMTTFHREKKELNGNASYVFLVLVLLVINVLLNVLMYFLASILAIR